MWVLVGWLQQHPISPKYHCNQGETSQQTPHSGHETSPPHCASVSPPEHWAPPPPTITLSVLATLYKRGGYLGGRKPLPPARGGGQAVKLLLGAGGAKIGGRGKKKKKKKG